jgi:hypothetical protein
MLIAILILIFIIIVASVWWFGLWSNLITLVNVLLSALIATSFYENAAYELTMRFDSFVLLFPFVSMWLLFVVSYMVLRTFTDTLSGVRLKFDRITELVGRSILAVLVAGVFVCFISFTLQRAPLKENLFSNNARGGFGNPIGPDRLWVRFMQNCSGGSLSYTAEETSFFPAFESVRKVNGVDEKYEVRMFDHANDSYFGRGSDLRKSIAEREMLRLPEGWSKKSNR